MSGFKITCDYNMSPQPSVCMPRFSNIRCLGMLTFLIFQI
jgi:hypothetical protein